MTNRIEILSPVTQGPAGPGGQNATAADLMLISDGTGFGAWAQSTPTQVRALLNVEDGATADQTGAEIKALYEAEADTNAFTDAEQTKLAGIETAATADQTGAEIKAAYEGEADTNAFTDALLSKLNGIETAATADQTGAEIKALYEAEADTNALTDERAARVDQLPDVDGFATSLASILSFTPTGTSYFDQRAYKDIIREGEPGRSYYTEAASATRGSRKEFPLRGAVAWSADTVAIVDMEGGQPELWMVFNGGGLNKMLGTSAIATINDAEIKCGLMAVSSAGSSSGVLIVVDFLEDAGRLLYNATNGGKYPGGIADRNTTASWVTNGGGYGVALVNRDANAVAISDPLDHYPLDEYGRPAFAIACATDGGVSVILPDADNRGKRVTDSLDTNGFSIVDWDGATLIYSGRNASRASYRAELAAIEAGDGWGAFFLGAPYSNSVLEVRSDDPEAGVFEDGQFVYGTAASGAVYIAPKYPAGQSLKAYLTSTAFSGWMPGDCKLALDFNAYAAGSVAASTPLDDDFTSYADTAALTAVWADISGGSASVTLDAANDEIDLNGAADGRALAVDTITTVAGETYVVEVTDAGGVPYSIVVGTSSGGNQLFSGTDATGSRAITFTAQSTTSYVTLRSRQVAETASIAAVTVKRAIPDLSPATNGAVINGTLTAAAVETGADLFALSGFSTSNYLEVPYSSDFDFGTGDFNVSFWINTTEGGTVYILSRGDPSYSSAGRWGLAVTGGNALRFNFEGAAIKDFSGADFIDGTWHKLHFLRRSGTFYLYVDGSLPSGNTLTSTRNFTAGTDLDFYVGVLSSLVSSFTGSIALPRVTKGYAPTPEQIRRMYEDERKLFEADAKCFLPSDTVNSLDARDGLLAIGTEGGAVIHDGFKRLELLDSGDIGLTENGVDSVALLGGNDIAAVTGTEGVARLAPRNLAEAQVVDAYSYERDFAGKGYTTDATPLDIAKLPLAEGELIEWRGSITARSDDGTERASYTRVVRAYRDVNGNATLAGADTLGTDDETTAGMDVAFAADTTAQTIDLQVTGVASTNIQWSFDGTLVVNKQ